jgi:hypothetical protein
LQNVGIPSDFAKKYTDTLFATEIRINTLALLKDTTERELKELKFALGDIKRMKKGGLIKTGMLCCSLVDQLCIKF